MSVAIVGILIFQIYWISNTYDVARTSFKIEVNDALETVLSKDLTDKTLRRIFGIQDIGQDSLANLIQHKNPSVIYQSQPDLLLVDSTVAQKGDYHIEWSYEEYQSEQYYQIREGDHIDTLVITRDGSQETWVTDTPGKEDETSFILHPDDWYNLFGNVVVSITEHRPDLTSLAEKYREELSGREINIPFELAYLDQDRIFESTADDPSIFKNAQAIQNMPGRFNEGDQIMAFFPKTSTFVLKRMWLTLLGSVLLVSLVAGSFFLMMQTILRQKKVSEVKNDFINNMTHEFKTPIATVSAAMEALTSFDGLDDRERSLRYIDITKGELDRLSGLVEKVLSISVFEEKKIILNKETFDVCKLVSETAQQYILKGGGQVFVEFDSNVPAYIHADKVHFQNVANNLLDNAVKYAHEEVTIKLSCMREGDFVVLKVIDDGVGIAKDQQKLIFDKFYRVPTGDLHRVKGFGLGLSYVKHIVELHGGSIGVQSQPGIGSEFTIAIPDIHEQTEDIIR